MTNEPESVRACCINSCCTLNRQDSPRLSQVVICRSHVQRQRAKSAAFAPRSKMVSTVVSMRWSSPINLFGNEFNKNCFVPENY